MLKFCFPERDPETIDIDSTDDLEGEGSSKGKKAKTNRKSKETNFYVPIEHKDDVEKMKVVPILLIFIFHFSKKYYITELLFISFYFVLRKELKKINYLSI